MIKTIIGTKLIQSQLFTRDGVRIPVTYIKVEPNRIIDMKTVLRDGYNALQVGIGTRRANITSKALLGHFKSSGGDARPPRFLKEIDIDEADMLDEKYKKGAQIGVGDVLKNGDIVKVTGISKGKGFQGVVKRHNFKGGPRTHGQSDRERAPGSIGQTTTPGRVYKGKRMAGRMGGDTVSIRNLEVIKIEPENNILIIKGLVPGARRSLLIIKKTKDSIN